MNKHYFGDYVRVSKAVMPSVIKRNINFIVIPCNGRLNTPWHLEIEINPAEMLENYGSFQNFLNNYEYYNCNNELGRYAAFYVNYKDLKR